MKSDHDLLRETYPAIISGDQLCRVCPPLCTAEEARARLTALWREEPDALAFERTTEPAGYSSCTIGRWIKAGKLAAVWYFSRYQIAKLSLIERPAVMSEHEPQRLSARHREMLKEAEGAPPSSMV